jgi:uncharacterized membrane protein YkoI
MEDRMKLFVAGGVIAGVLLAGVGIAFAVGGGDDDGLSGGDFDQASAAAVEEAGGGRVTSAEQADGEDAYAYEVEVTREDGTQVDVLLDERFAVIGADEEGVEDGGDDDGPGDDDGNEADDAPISAADRTAASEAAVAEAGGGTVTDLDREDDGGSVGWEVEVTLDDGREVDVRLDEQLAVVSASDPHTDD